MAENMPEKDEMCFYKKWILEPLYENIESYNKRELDHGKVRHNQ